MQIASILKTGLVLLACIAFAGRAHGQAAPYIVVDVQNGAVYGHRNAYKRWAPASLTKLMSAYVTFRALKAREITLNSPVRQSKNSRSEPPSKMGYSVGTVMTIDNALKIILVKSANDISVALAEGVAGSEKAFVARMNLEARRLGMTGTRFTNPHGLNSSRQYTTARDMAVLAIAIRREFPEHAWRFRVPAISSGKKVLRNYNVLIGRFKGGDGMKTGFVCASGFNLVGSATRRGRSIVSVVLGAASQNERAELSANLLARAFGQSSRGKPTVRTLQPYGENRNVMANMRPKICSSKAQRARWEVRDKQGRLKISTPHIRARTGKLQIIPIKLGGATGPKTTADGSVPTIPKTPIDPQVQKSGTRIAATQIVPRFRPPNAFDQQSASLALRGSQTTGNQQAANAINAAAPPTPSSDGSLARRGPPALFAPIPRFRPN